MKILNTVAAALLAALSCPAALAGQAGELSLDVPEGRLTVTAIGADSFRVRVTPPGATDGYESLTVTAPAAAPAEICEKGGERLLTAGRTTAAVDVKTGRVRFLDQSGRAILSEVPGGRRFVRAKLPDGTESWTPEQAFDAPEDESIYGLGQHQDGRLDWRGETVCLRQGNTEASVPVVWSTRGYALLWDNPSETWFNPGAEIPLKDGKGEFIPSESGRYSLWLDRGKAGSFYRENTVLVDGREVASVKNLWVTGGVGGSAELEAGRRHGVETRTVGPARLYVRRSGEPRTVWRSKAGGAVDYCVFAGGNPRSAMARYRRLSGGVPMLPKYAYGFWQCRERYDSSAEILEELRGFRSRGIPVDVIVQDWQYWGKYGWNAMKWDEGRYPDVPALAKGVHDMNAKLMVSVWSKFGRGTEPFAELSRMGCMIGGTEWFDPTSEAARRKYWELSRRAFHLQGVDAYWQDAVEPEDPVVDGAKLAVGGGTRYQNSYPLFVSRCVYEGLRGEAEDRRPVILTRCAYAGQQRYGSVVWSGDVNSSWDSLRRQLVAGLGFMSSGMPYWTYDAGGFFRNVDVSDLSGGGNPGAQYDSPDYREKLVRWVETAAFLPVMRVHGYQSKTAPWHYGKETEDLLVSLVRLRYRLLPYFYSMGWKTHRGDVMMRPVAMDFPGERGLRNVKDEFMCGDSLLVAPVMEGGARRRKVVLPDGCGWRDFWSGRSVGPGVVEAEAPLGRPPVFARAGSIIPVGPVLQWSGEKSAEPVEIRVYPGADGAFTLYDDAGDGHGYEKGEFAEIGFVWDDSARKLTVGGSRGSFPGAPQKRVFKVRLAGDPAVRTVESAATPVSLAL